MHANDITFAKRSNLKALVFAFAARVLNHMLDGHRRSRGRILLMSMVPLEDLSRVIMAQGRPGRSRDVEKQIYAYGKIRRVYKPYPTALD